MLYSLFFSLNCLLGWFNLWVAMFTQGCFMLLCHCMEIFLKLPPPPSKTCFHTLKQMITYFFPFFNLFGPMLTHTWPVTPVWTCVDPYLTRLDPFGPVLTCFDRFSPVLTSFDLWYYQQTFKDSVSPLCRIFTCCPNFYHFQEISKKSSFNLGFFLTGAGGCKTIQNFWGLLVYQHLWNFR